MLNVKRCAIIVRVSDPRQAEKDRSSLDNQKSEIEAFIKMKNLVKDGPRYERFEVYELEGVSGKHSIVSDRFVDLKTDIVKGDVDVVICTDLDRLGRNVVEFVNFFKFLRDYHVDLVSTRLGLDTSTHIGEAIVVILMAMAQLENRIKSEKVLQARYQRSQEGLFNGKRPVLGYDLNPNPKEAGRLLVNEAEAEIVRLAFRLYLELGSDSAVSKRLTDLGYRNKAWTQRETGERRGGGPITASVVKTILTNVIYIGMQHITIVNPGTGKKEKKDKPGCWIPIVDDDLFHLVQEARRKTLVTRRNIAQSSRHFYLLRDIVSCGFCGEAMKTGSGTSKTGRRHHYYICRNNDCSHFATGARRNKVDADKADHSVYDAFGRIASNEANIQRIVKLSNEFTQIELPMLRAEKRKLGEADSSFMKEIESKATALANLDKSSPASDSLRQEIEDLEARLTRVRERLAEIDRSIRQIESTSLTKEEVLKRLRDLRMIVDNAPEEQRREILKFSCERVLVRKEELDLEFLPSSLLYTHALSTKDAEFAQIETWLPGEDLNLEPSG